MPAPERILTYLRQAITLTRATPGRRGHVVELQNCTEVLVAGDLHGHVGNFQSLLKAADLGISINISAPMDDADRCCRECGISRHSVEYSVGFRGRLERLPDSTILELSTMCGHGMLSAHFAKKMLEWVKENRRTPAEAARYMARFCICGVFNIGRAERIIKRCCGFEKSAPPQAEEQEKVP